MMNRMFLLVAVCLLATSSFADVELIEFTEKSKWEAAVGSFETIDFTGSTHGELVDDDYTESHGATFSNAYYWNTISFVNDDWGFRNNAFVDTGVWVEFDEPKMWIAADHPGIIQFDLYFEDNLIASSNPFLGGGGTGNFSGLTSSEPFDRVYLYRPEQFSDTVWVDDLHFGAPIPVPGALGVMAVGVLLLPRRRRRNGRTP